MSELKITIEIFLVFSIAGRLFSLIKKQHFKKTVGKWLAKSSF